MEVLSLMSFRDELMKIASPDGEMRANMADRAGLRIGTDFLPGGELASNTPGKNHLTDKTAAPNNFEHKSYEKYKKIREPGGAALKGGIYGGFVGNLVQGMEGKNKTRAGAMIGAGLGVGDWIARGKARKWATKAKAKEKKAALSSFSPGMAKRQSSSTGRFQDQTIHKGSPLRPTQMGHTFKIPSEPGQ